ncbi:MAG: response regulator transcription factor [Deltaproteobacteria bacterium]|nr:response regulator transcription factor [Deltaproteobacteria bacterium]
MGDKIRVLIADDHAIVREGACRLLNAQPDMEVVGEASEGPEVLTKAQELKPDVVVLDISLPGLTGLDLVPLLRQALPRTQIAVLSVHNKQAFVQQILHSGALAYVLKTSPTSALLDAIRAVHQGEYYLSAKVRAEVIGSYLRQPAGDGAAGGHTRLSEREQQVFRLVAKGKTNREIAEILFLSPRTVEKYRAQAMQKLDLKDLVEVIHYAIQHGLVVPEE